MARIGLRKAKYNLIDKNTGKYEALVDNKVPMFEKLVDEKFAPEFNSAELYGNDSLCESDYTFKSGKLSLTVVDDEDVFIAKIFGSSVDTNQNQGQVKQNVDDIAPELGYGHIIPKVVGGVRKYKVEFLPRIKFQSISAEASTKGDGVEFKTIALEAKVFAVDSPIGQAVNGDWEIHKTFDNVQDAEAYLDSLLTPTN